jgi:hypothetical protein
MSHKNYINWYHSEDQIMGKNVTDRVYGKGYTPPGTKLETQPLIDFWGKAVLSLADTMWKAIKQRGIYAMRLRSKKPRYFVEPKDILSVSVLFVEFEAHSGKYRGETRCRFPCELPSEVGPARGGAGWWPVVHITFSKPMDDFLKTWMKAPVEAELVDKPIERDSDAESIDLDMPPLQEDIEMAPPETTGPQAATATASHAASSSSCAASGAEVACIWCSCKEQVKEEIPEAWPLPLARL